MAPYRALFEPLTIRGKTFRNRVFSSGHVPGYTPEGYPNERYIAYNREKAKGGIGLITFGGSTNIARESTSIFGGLNVRSNDDIPHYRRLADAVHAEGAALMCQITHMGRHCRTDAAEWLPVAAPSQVRDPGGGRALPRAMDEEDIAQAIGDYVLGAQRLAEAGLDGVEIISSMHLPGQFLNPISNRREDEYGGSLENRTLFLRQVLEACRAGVPDDFIVGVRYTADEKNEGGISAEDGIEVARILGAHGVSDFLNVNGAYSGTQQGVNVAFPGMEAKSAPYVELARRVREVSGLVTMQASRLDTLNTANWAVESGALDMAGMTRPHIADPHLVIKAQRGDEHRIRPCVGAGYCLDRPYLGLDALCMHNPSTSRETALPHEIERAPKPLKAFVVGGGPAGLEAARVLAERGHAVTLAEATDRLGGQLVLAVKAGWRKGLQGVVDWLAGELEHLGVQIRYNTFVEPDEIAGHDIIILATGGVPLQDLPGGGAELTLTAWDVLGEGKVPEGDVLVYDEVGGHAALSMAHQVSDAGANISFATMDSVLGRNLGAQNKPVYLGALRSAGAQFLADTRLVGLKRSGNRVSATLEDRWSRDHREQEFDAVIIDQGVAPDNDLFDALAPGAANGGRLDLNALADGRPQPQSPDEGQPVLYRIGDALMSRDVHSALYEARRLCRNL